MSVPSPPTAPPTWPYTLGVVIVLSVIAWWALPTAIQAGDAGEFATVMLEGGVPHPSGYPWMRGLGLVARLLRALGMNPATAAALPCAACAVAGFALLHRVSLHCATAPGAEPGHGSAWLASAVVVVLAIGAPVVAHSADSEVWGPLILTTGLVCAAAMRWRLRPAWLGLLFGLAVSHHLSAVLLLPLVVSAALPRPLRWRATLRAGAEGVGGGVLGLLPYLSLAIGHEGAWSWGDTGSASGLLHHVSRADYGVLSLSLHTETPPAIEQLTRVASSLGSVLSAGLVTMALGGAGLVLLVLVLTVRADLHCARHLRIGLVLTFIAAAILFPLAHNINPVSPFGAWILERFDLMPLAILIPACTAALSPLPRTLVGRSRFAQVGLLLCGALLALRQFAVTAWHGVPADNPHVERFARDVLRTPPPGPAIIVGTDDHRIFPLLFVQSVHHTRPEVLYIDGSLLAHDWYRAWLRERMPRIPDIDKPVRLLTALQQDPRWAGVPLYLTNDFSRHSVALPRVPEGLLWRLLDPTKPPPPPAEVVERHKLALARYGPPPDTKMISAHPFAIDLITAYTEGTTQLALALERGGDVAQAEALLRFALQPSPAPTP